MSLPQDITPAEDLKSVLAFCLLFLSLIGLAPGILALCFGGISGVFDWPFAFLGLVFVSLGLLITGFRIYRSPRRVGMDVVFEEGGFSVEIRSFLSKDRSNSLAWRDIEEVRVVKVRPGANTISFRLSHDAAVRHGLIQPTTRASAPKILVRREVTLPTGLCSISIDEVFDRFKASAQYAGATLIKTASSSVVVSRTVWSVAWPRPDDTP